MQNQRISTQSVRNLLREARLNARRPHCGLDPTAPRHPTRWRLAARGDLHGFHGTGQMVGSVHGIGDASHQLLTGFLTPPPEPH